jgi:hypothetical protein
VQVFPALLNFPAHGANSSRFPARPTNKAILIPLVATALVNDAAKSANYMDLYID